MSTLGLCVVALLVICITHWIYKWRNPKCNGILPPGSMGLPLIGETIHLIIPSYSLDVSPFIKKRLQRYMQLYSYITILFHCEQGQLVISHMVLSHFYLCHFIFITLDG